MRVATCLLLFVAAVWARPQETDIDPALLESVFGTPRPEPAQPLPPAGGGIQKITPPNNVVDTGSCVCVKYYLCQNGTINTDGTGIIDIRLGGTKPHQCDDYIDYCCEKPTEDVIRPPVIIEPDGGYCGHRQPDGAGFRIIGDMDNESQFGEFPWMTALLRKEIVDDKTELNVYQCGASLIHPQVVLTAAHCIASRQPGELLVRLGEWDTQRMNELHPHQDIPVAQYVIHPDYYAGALHNDIALLLLDREAEAMPTVSTACLAPPEFAYDPQNCVASGWGKDVFGKEGRYQVILKKIELQVTPHDRCQAALRTTRLGYHFRLHKSFICAGGEKGKDTCKGDGGSPLVCKVPGGKQDQYVQVGIVAWGIGCGEDGIPGVYVNVPMFYNWIESTIAKRFKLPPSEFYKIAK